MDLDLSVRHHGDRATIQIGGEVDAATCPQLQAVLVELVEGGYRQLIIDLQQVSFMDCTGIGVLVEMMRRAQEHDCSLRLVRPSRFVWRLLELTSMTTAFPIDTSLDEALTTEPVRPEDAA